MKYIKQEQEEMALHKWKEMTPHRKRNQSHNNTFLKQSDAKYYNYAIVQAVKKENKHYYKSYLISNERQNYSRQ